MSGSYHNGAQPSVDGWLNGQYEYMVPDKDISEHTGASSYIPRDPYRNHTPEYSEEGSSRGKGHGSPREQYHSTAKERYTPASPPPEDDLEHDRHLHGSGQAHQRDQDHEVGRDERRPRHDRDAKHPPKADHGRPRRPPLNTAATTPHLTAGLPTKDGDTGGPRRRRYSQSSSLPKHHSDRYSRPQAYSHRHVDRSPSPAPHSSRKEGRDKDNRSQHGGSSHDASSSTTKPHRPSLSRSQTAPYGKDLKKPGSSSRSFSFLKDPRFMTAAEAALQAGAAAALSSGSGGGKWGGDKGAKVLRAGLGAAALSALKSPVPAEPAAAPVAPAAAAVGPGGLAGEKAGRYAAGHVGRKGGTRRKHH